MIKRMAKAWSRGRVWLALTFYELLKPTLALRIAGVSPIVGGASAPYEVQLAADVNVYYAPTGEAAPDVVNDADPATVGNWALLADCEHISEAGVVLRTSTQIQVIRTLCSINAVKTSFTAKDLAFEFEVLDTRLEAVALGDGQDPATAITDNGDYKSYDFNSNPIPQGFSLLFRWGQSGYGDVMNSQIFLPSAVQSGDGGPNWSKSTPWGWKHVWTALKTTGNPIGTFDEQTVAAT